MERREKYGQEDMTARTQAGMEESTQVGRVSDRHGGGLAGFQARRLGSRAEGMDA